MYANVAICQYNTAHKTTNRLPGQRWLTNEKNIPLYMDW